jgi:hypothetical protein
MEISKSKGSIENLDLCGHLAQELFSTFVATLMSVTDNLDDPDEGHRWLHGWLDTSGVGGTCETAFNQARDFGNVLLNHDTLDECMFVTRMVVAERAGVEKMAKSIGEGIASTIQRAFDGAPSADRANLETDINRILDKLGVIFGEYATPENRLGEVKETCEAITKFVPFHALGIYITNAMLAVNWGLVDYALINAIRTEPLIGDKMDIRVMRGNDDDDEGDAPGRGGYDQDTLEDFRDMFGGGE